MTSDDGLWRDILEARYGSWRNIDVSLIHRNQSLWWMDLCRISGKGIQGNWFEGRSQWSLVDRSRVKF